MFGGSVFLPTFAEVETTKKDIMVLINLENKKIIVVEAVTLTNSNCKSSRLTGAIIQLKKVIFERLSGSKDDAIFFESIELDKGKGKVWRPMFMVNDNTIYLDNISNSRAKSILITKFKIN